MVDVCNRGEGVIPCCDYFLRDRDTQTDRSEAFAWRLESNGWETVGSTQEGCQRPSQRVAYQPYVRVGEEGGDVVYEVLSKNVNLVREMR